MRFGVALRPGLVASVDVSRRRRKGKDWLVRPWIMAASFLLDVLLQIWQQGLTHPLANAMCVFLSSTLFFSITYVTPLNCCR